MKIFIINLKESVDRRQFMANQLEKTNLDYEFIEAVNGKELDNPQQYLDECKCITQVKRLMTAGEIGCYLSHLKLWKKIRDENIERACILEDDVVLKPEFSDVLAAIAKRLDDTLYYLHCVNNGRKPFLSIEQLHQDYHLGLYKWHDLGALGYVLGQQTAAQLCKYSEPLSFEVDRLMYRSWLHSIPLRHVYPPVVGMCDLESTLLADRAEEGRNQNGQLTISKAQKSKHRTWKLQDSYIRKIWLIKHIGLKQFLKLAKLS